MALKTLFNPRNLLLLAVLAWSGWQYLGKQAPLPIPTNATTNQLLVTAHAQQRSGQWFTVIGTVVKTLSDDRQGSQHQRFILGIDQNFTVLVAHNIDLASRVPLQVGDQLKLRGEYQWNRKGGVLHWTHADPGGRRRGGWIELRGQRYR